MSVVIMNKNKPLEQGRCHHIKILGIGDSGLNSIQYLQDQSALKKSQTLSFAVAHVQNNCLDSKQEVELISVDPKNIDIDNTKSQNDLLGLAKIYPEGVQGQSILFIVVDLSDTEYHSFVKNFLERHNKMLNKQYELIIGITCGPTQEEGNKNLNYGDGILQQCDLIIPSDRKNNRMLSYESTYQSIWFFINVLMRPGMIISSFADVRHCISTVNTGVIISASATGCNRAKSALQGVLKKIAVIKNKQLNTEITAVIIDMCTADLSISEFDEVGQVIVGALPKAVYYSIGVTTDDYLKNTLQINVLVMS